jgi:hypothetical protein
MSQIIKVSLIILLAPLLVFASNDDDTVRIKLSERDFTLYVNWYVEEEIEEISIEIENNGTISTVSLSENSGYQPICCFYGDIVGTLRVLLSTGEFVRVEDSIFIEEPDVEFPEVPDTILRPTTTTTVYTTTTVENIREIESNQISTPATTNNSETISLQNFAPNLQLFNFTDVDIDNEIIKSIPTFEEIDFSNNEKNKKATFNTLLIVILFYLVLALQEWLNKLINDYDLKFIKKDKEIATNKFLKVPLALFIVSFLISFVEEGALLKFEKDNILLFIAVALALLIVTFFYDVIELMQEITFSNSTFTFDWSLQAIFFSLFSFLIFILFELPVGFLFGYVVLISIKRTSNKKSKISPKILSNLITVAVGYTAILSNEIYLFKNSTLVSTVLSLIFLFTIEGSFFKSLPIGGNEYVESIKDSNVYGKILSTVVFIFSIWSFVRLIVLPSDGEVANFSNELANMGEYAIYFAFVVFAYALLILISGLVLITFGEKSNS